MPITFLPLSWNELQSYTFSLASTIAQSKTRYDRMVSISRGGLVVSRMLSDALQLPISNFTLVSYTGIGTAGDPEIKEELGVAIDGETILLVDEIVESGKTLEVAIEYLTKLHPTKIDTAVLVKKPQSTFAPTYSCFSTSDWVVFPYEVRETIQDIFAAREKLQFTDSQCVELVRTFGFPDNQVEAFLKKLRSTILVSDHPTEA